MINVSGHTSWDCSEGSEKCKAQALKQVHWGPPGSSECCSHWLVQCQQLRLGTTASEEEERALHALLLPVLRVC